VAEACGLVPVASAGAAPLLNPALSSRVEEPFFAPRGNRDVNPDISFDVGTDVETDGGFRSDQGGGVSISCNGCYGSPPVPWERLLDPTRGVIA